VGPIRVRVIDVPTSSNLVASLTHWRAPVVGLVIIGSLAAGWIARNAHFDYSVLALKDPDAESVRTHKELQASGITTDYALTLMTDEDWEGSHLESLEVVSEVITPASMIPSEQETKLLSLQDAAFLLESALDPVRNLSAPTPMELAEQTGNLVTLLQSADMQNTQHADALHRLRLALADLSQAPTTTLLVWQEGVVSDLVDELEWLRRAITTSSIAYEDLPSSVRQRLINPNGYALVVVLPEEDITPVVSLTRFIEAVRGLEPHATGRPVIEWGVGQIVTSSFQIAMTIAVVSIGLLLIVIFRRPDYALLIAVPLLLTAVFTLAAGVLLNIPLNMANILVLPLIFGLGVDNGVHVVDRYRDAGDVEHLMHSSTPRAVLLSTLTTIGTFAALSLSPHQGTASIGLLLTIAVGFLLVFTVLLLPVLLSFSEAPKGK
jgi:hypothetical protein